MGSRSAGTRGAMASALWVMSVAAGTFVLMWALLRFFTEPSLSAPLWWPISALFVVVLMRCRRRWRMAATAGFVAGSILADAGDKDWRLAASFLAASVAEALIASVMLGARRPRGHQLLHVARDGFRFVVAVVVAVGTGALVIATVVLWYPTGPVTASVIELFAISHGLGYLTIAPLLLSGRLIRPASPVIWTEFAVTGLGAGALSLWALMDHDATGRAFVMLVPVIWAAVRLDALKATVISFLTCALAAYATAHDRGPMANAVGFGERQFLTEIFILVVAAATAALVLVTRHRQQLAARATDSEQTLLVAIRDALIGMYSIRIEPGRLGEIRDVNTAMCDMLGYRREELIGRHCSIFGARHDPVRRAQLQAHLEKFIDGSMTSLREESMFYTATGEPRWVELSLSAVRSVGEPQFVLVHANDMTARERAKQSLEKMALHDPLTGVANRTLLFRRINDELAANRAGGVTGLLYLDLDGFKDVNDTYGHDAGDAVLIAAARRMVGAVRQGATVARLGGDEFAVLCPASGGEGELMVIADRMRGLLREPIRLPGGGSVTIDVSIGVGAVRGDETADVLVHLADRSMYRVKADRRV